MHNEKRRDRLLETSSERSHLSHLIDRSHAVVVSIVRHRLALYPHIQLDVVRNERVRVFHAHWFVGASAAHVQPPVAARA